VRRRARRLDQNASRTRRPKPSGQTARTRHIRPRGREASQVGRQRASQDPRCDTHYGAAMRRDICPTECVAAAIAPRGSAMSGRLLECPRRTADVWAAAAMFSSAPRRVGEPRPSFCSQAKRQSGPRSARRNGTNALVSDDWRRGDGETSGRRIRGVALALVTRRSAGTESRHRRR